MTAAQWHKECVRLRGLVIGAEAEAKKAERIADRLAAQKTLQDHRRQLSAHRMAYGQFTA